MSSESDKAKLFTEELYNFDDSEICLPAFPSRTNLKLQISNLDSSKIPGPGSEELWP